VRNRLPSPALVIACLALAVSLGGVGYAATKLPRNSVGKAQLKANAVDSSKVKNGALKRVDFAKGQIPPGSEKGVILVSVPPQTWVQLGGSSLPMTYFSDATRVTSSGTANDIFLGAEAPVPLALYGKRVRLLGAEICYSTSSDVKIDNVSVNVLHQPSGPDTTTPGPEVIDPTDRTNDAACRVYTLPSPATLTGDDLVVLAVEADFTAATNLTVGRATVILQPTTTNAVTPTG
jgi:hypothetical protein